MRHNRLAHGKKPEVVDEMLYAWIEKHMGVVGSALHMDERLIIAQDLQHSCELVMTPPESGLFSC